MHELNVHSLCTKIALFSLTMASVVTGGAFASDQDAPWTPAGITSKFIDRGWQFTTDNGETIYQFAQESVTGEPRCYDECAESWLPVGPGPVVTAEGDWSIATREDGIAQWVYRNQPLYTFKDDPFPGATFGATARNDWDVFVQPIPLPPTFAITEIALGYVLVGENNRTVYSSEAEQIDAGSSSVRPCDLTCMQTWKPIYAPQLANTVGDFDVVDWPDGTRQWAFKRRPLYYYAGDAFLGHILGQNIDGRLAVVLSAPQPIPTWVKEQSTDAGKLLALSNGHVLYTYRKPATYNSVTKCDQACFDLFWEPVLASQQNGAVGDWTVIDNEGVSQWAFKGLPLYVSKVDEWPGDLSGTKVWLYRDFKTINRTGRPIAKLF